MSDPSITAQHRERRVNPATAIVPIALAVLLAAGCAGNVREVVGKPPQAGIDGMALAGTHVVLELALRNVNDASLELTAIAVELQLDGQPLAEGRQGIPLVIAARGREVVSMRLAAEPAGLDRLSALSAGDHDSLRWSMKLTLEQRGRREQQSEATGWLHRVPGQDDRFR